MTSIMTNTSAMVALQTLRSINNSLDSANNRISTGLKVNTAADNAAYWSIATTTRSDNGQLGAVKDALNLGAQTVNTATTAMNANIKTLQEVQAKLTAALSPNVDRGKIQTEIGDLLKRLKDTSDSAVQAGENWLSVDGNAGNYVSDRKIVASFTRTDGKIEVGTVNVSVDDTKLYDTKTAAGTAGAGATVGTIQTTWVAAQGTYEAAVAAYEASDKSAAAKGTLDAAKTAFDTAKATYDFQKAAANKTAVNGTDGSGGILNKEYAVLAADENGFLKGFKASVETIDISNIDNQDLSKLRAYIQVVDKALTSMTDAATTLGSVSSRISGQTNFVESLIKANEQSIGALVDANMEEESTKLKALQVQQQLGVQSLSIANSAGQNILSLFR